MLSTQTSASTKKWVYIAFTILNLVQLEAKFKEEKARG